MVGRNFNFMVEDASCMICSSKDYKVILKASYFKVLECTKCKLAFTFPAPKLPDYANMDFHSKNKECDEEHLINIIELPYDWQNLLNSQVKVINENYPTSASLLEIGCGEGILLTLLKEHGYNRISGIEPSYSASKRASKRGIKVINAFFDDTAFKEKYDLIILSHVLEHIPDPMNFLDKVASILTETGGILLTQTNYKGLIPSFMKDKWYAWVPDQHYWHFTPNVLNQLLSKARFKPIANEFCSLVHPHNFIYKVAKLRAKWQDQTISLYIKNSAL